MGLFHLSSVYRIKCLGEIYEQLCPGHCWRSKDILISVLISDVFFWTSTHERARIWRPAYTGTVWTLDAVLEDLSGAMDDEEERVSELHAINLTWWWWWWWYKVTDAKGLPLSTIPKICQVLGSHQLHNHPIFYTMSVTPSFQNCLKTSPTTLSFKAV